MRRKKFSFRDLRKSLVFLRNALSLLTLVTVENVHAKYKVKFAILIELSDFKFIFSVIKEK